MVTVLQHWKETEKPICAPVMREEAAQGVVQTVGGKQTLTVREGGRSLILLNCSALLRAGRCYFCSVNKRLLKASFFSGCQGRRTAALPFLSFFFFFLRWGEKAIITPFFFEDADKRRRVDQRVSVPKRNGSWGDRNACFCFKQSNSASAVCQLANVTQLHPETLSREERKKRLREKGQLCPHMCCLCVKVHHGILQCLGRKGHQRSSSPNPCPGLVAPTGPGCPEPIQPGLGHLLGWEWVPLGCLPINVYSRCLENVLEGSNITLFGSESVFELSGAVGGSN